MLSVEWWPFVSRPQCVIYHLSLFWPLPMNFNNLCVFMVTYYMDVRVKSFNTIQCIKVWSLSMMMVVNVDLNVNMGVNFSHNDVLLWVIIFHNILSVIYYILFIKFSCFIWAFLVLIYQMQSTDGIYDIGKVIYNTCPLVPRHEQECISYQFH